MSIYKETDIKHPLFVVTLENGVTLLVYDGYAEGSDGKIYKPDIMDIDDDEIEFISYKVGKMEGDFDTNLNEFLTNNTKFGTNKNSTPTKATGIETKPQTVPQESCGTAILKSKHPELYN